MAKSVDSSSEMMVLIGGESCEAVGEKHNEDGKCSAGVSKDILGVRNDITSLGIGDHKYISRPMLPSAMVWRQPT